MTDPLQAVLIIVGAIFVIVLINIAILRTAAKNKHSDAQTISNAITQFKNPWQKENQDLDELAKLVAKSKGDRSAGRNSEEKSQENNSS